MGVDPTAAVAGAETPAPARAPGAGGTAAAGLEWLETFVERGRFAGTCYRAANWRCEGQTACRSRQDRQHTRTVPVKDIYLYHLGEPAR